MDSVARETETGCAGSGNLDNLLRLASYNQAATFYYLVEVLELSIEESGGRRKELKALRRYYVFLRHLACLDTVSNVHKELCPISATSVQQYLRPTGMLIKKRRYINKLRWIGVDIRVT